MQTQRKKTRNHHVRTGCITCKRRRVKCSEEHPHCSRCVRGRFVCEGYAVPKAWIFESTATGVAGSADVLVPSTSSLESRLTNLSILTQVPGDSTIEAANASISSPLQFGNSDPFNAYAVPIGPSESYILRSYHDFVTLQHTQSGSKAGPSSAFVTTYYTQCLQHETAAYGLLARNAAVLSQTPHSSHAAESTSVLHYMTRSQTALRKQLLLANGGESPESVYAVMWAASFLATVELILQRPNIQIHVRAICKLVERYVDLVAEELNPISVLYPIYVIFCIASMTLTRPLFDMDMWFPQAFQASWTKVSVLLRGKTSATTKEYIHEDVKDNLLRSFIMSQRNDWENYSCFLGVPRKDLHPDDEMSLTNATVSREAWYYGRMLNLAADAMERLTSSDLSLDQMHDSIASAYISISMLLWVHIKNTGVSVRRAYSVVGLGLLQHLKSAIIKSTSLQGPDRYATAKLWALFMAVHSEIQRQVVHGLDLAGGNWFLEAFRKQASSMQIRSWQHAISKFEDILYDQAMRPHISEWWYQVCPNHD